ncbi:MAG: Lysyl-tRNA synthetase [Microgenomates group bacterium GW2011_GWC1_43_13]|uniref:Lysine--tRNA ligase n=2 Tax=Candidatus Woeseibacteriota TaxID=1752722 RepID=A0A1F8DI43_9BACT|nr:MAG: Lysyl-tRNA synthetase [Microgenomates group bacterium GW2011_GWC1_43_13]KKT32995.1 MAG: Lysine-tRNA ligase [Candidatus Woesebacteria bacterium GW2011_GWB1_44_11]OGM75928.1 MAG: lysine--tRNA ligase [Candidatus Woesebacteria bacterium RIFOXYA1_FULL_43_16]OGM81459.1 MAG: lysine--tRNA ligase [Candidatus Woesebacteria bacterium RIFOXYB1_FULL_42_36]OGM84680.1 MAG: lysine--tRNA ligase [Candidatus Woesebacteria bacterium RIFOXYC1_FULL_43_18]OGM88290.1 MAG: lysine--tRNA ligase [Candidatus Woese
MAKALKTLIETRLKKLQEFRRKGINPYPSKVEIDGELINTKEASGKLDSEVLVAGRIWSIREHGAVAFMDLTDESGKIQVLFQKKTLAEKFELLNLFDMGDFLAVKGKVIKTQAGQITIDVSEFQILGKAIRPLPDDWFGLKDVEDRYRKRYLDLLFNPKVRERFNTRTVLIREIRRYLDNLGFWEVETPTLQPLYGGANAKPFKTHLNALDTDMYLRIADELYLKRLIVGGYTKVYEICKDFRNEGMDLTHNPEFTMIEYYEAYADYQRVMNVTEGLFKHLAKAIFGATTMQVGEYTVDINKNWPRISMADLLKNKLKLDVKKETQKSLEEYCRKNGVEILGGETKGQLIFTIFDHKVADTLTEPTWVIDYPKDVSPLSKNISGEEEVVERFEGYIGGKEICDGWSELTDPQEQRLRFETDKNVARKDKEEAQQVDEDFLEAMEYGMPPLGGIGIGIDRLTMFFTNTWSIKEVILNPTMRPVKNSKPQRKEGDKR